MAENKTRPADADVGAFISEIEHKTRKADAEILLDLMKGVTGFKPVMWGDSIVGFGRYHYRYESGHEGNHS